VNDILTTHVIDTTDSEGFIALQHHGSQKLIDTGKTDNYIKFRIGIIGLGNIAKQHIDNILKGHVKGAELIALCSRTDDSLATELGLKHFSSYQALIDSKLVDAIIIATPIGL